MTVQRAVRRWRLRAFPQTAETAWGPIVGVALIAVAARLYRLDSVALWTDELFTRFYPDAGLRYLWTEGLRTEPTSPLYYSLIWAVERTAGSAAWRCGRRAWLDRWRACGWPGCWRASCFNGPGQR